MIEVDSHWICESYYEHIKAGVEDQQSIIEDFEAKYYNDDGSGDL